MRNRASMQSHHDLGLSTHSLRAHPVVSPCAPDSILAWPPQDSPASEAAGLWRSPKCLDQIQCEPQRLSSKKLGVHSWLEVLPQGLLQMAHMITSMLQFKLIQLQVRVWEEQGILSAENVQCRGGDPSRSFHQNIHFRWLEGDGWK